MTNNKQVTTKVMFDTNVFNHIVDGTILPENIPHEWKIYVTHIQKDELNQTPDNHLKEKLLAAYERYTDQSVPTTSTVFNISRWDECGWGDEEELYSRILNDLNKKRPKPNNQKDALIAETAIKNHFVIITNDAALREISEHYGAQVKDIRIKQRIK